MAAAWGGCSKPATTAQAGESAPTEVAVAPFSADSALANVGRQVAFGPRTGGSDAHAKCASWLADELRRHGADTVALQRAELNDFGEMINIRATFNPAARRRILLLSHWDSRPWADEDPDPANHAMPIDGANDGASGVGVLLEVARQLGLQHPEIGVDILFVDAEDSGTEGDDTSWARGAQYFAENLPYGAAEPTPAYAILLDMVGGRGAVFPRELFSEANARAVNSRVWDLAKKIGLGSRFIDATGGAINDDHLPLLRAGIPAIDIIESANPQTGSFNPTWHTLADNLDNIDPQTLGDVGKLITTLIYSEKQ
ncbi:MAG: M28 family peptidase [Muribaculaceae bacterium]|nr:M28 family peptidase [Muribaculaceae bacterium]